MIQEIEIPTPQGTVFGLAAGNPGDPFVLGIHGWSQRNGAHTWQPLLAPLANAGNYVVSVNMPGWGKSAKWANQPLQPPEAAANILIAILDSLQVDQAALMGKSWGGGVALATALAYPERCGRLILTAPAFRDIQRLAGLRQPALMAWAEDDAVIPISYAAEYQKAMPQLQLEKYARGGHSAAQNNVEYFAPKAALFLKGRQANE